VPAASQTFSAAPEPRPPQPTMPTLMTSFLAAAWALVKKPRPAVAAVEALRKSRRLAFPSVIAGGSGLRCTPPICFRGTVARERSAEYRFQAHTTRNLQLATPVNESLFL